MTQIRPRIDEDLAAEVRAYGDTTLRLSFERTVDLLLRIGLRNAPRDEDGLIAELAASKRGEQP